MKCPSCRKDLEKTKLEQFEIALCDSCKGAWIDSFAFEELARRESPFSELLKIRIWDEATKYKVTPSGKTCPQCSKMLYKSEYTGSNVTMEICPSCKSIWFERGSLEKLFAYIDKTIDEETIGQLFEELGEELKEFLVGREPFDDEFKRFGLITKLLEYKIFSKFPLLQKLANAMPQ
jgi:Zn-finger nucleic acid-binding protein